MDKGEQSQAILLRHHFSSYTDSNTSLSDDNHCLSKQGNWDQNINGTGLGTRQETKPLLIQKHIGPSMFLIPS